MISAKPARDTRRMWRVGLGVAIAGVAAMIAAPAVAGPSPASPGALAVASSALPADMLPGESALIAVEISNVGGSPLTGVTLTESLPAALGYVAGSTVVVRTSAAGGLSLYSDSVPTASGLAGTLGAFTPGLLISDYDGVDLAPGESLRVTFLATLSSSLAPGVRDLSFTSLATSGDALPASATTTITVLEQALAWASSDAAN